MANPVSDWETIESPSYRNDPANEWETVDSDWEEVFAPIKPKAGITDVPGIVGRGVVSAELGVAKSLIGTIDAAINIPAEEVRKVATPWIPSQFAGMDTGLSNKLKEAKRRIQSSQKKFGARYSGALAWTTRTISEAVPYMANAMAAGVVVGPVGAATVGFVVEGDNAYDDAKASGATEEQAQRERVVIGSLNAIIEAIQVGKVMKFAKGGKHSLKNFVKLARTKGIKHAGKELKGWGGEVARLSIEEALEEFSQEGVSLAVPAVFRGEYPRKEDGSLDWLAIGDRLGQAALGGAVAGPVLGGAGRLITGVGPETDVAEPESPHISEALKQDIPPGSNVYETEGGRKVIETPADIGTEQGTELRDGRVYERATGEELFQVDEGTVSGIQDAPKSETADFLPVETEIDAGEEGPTAGKKAGLGQAMQTLVDEGMTWEDAQTVIRGQQEGRAATVDITESKETREQLLKVDAAIDTNEQTPNEVAQEDKLEEPAFNEPGLFALLTNKRKVMDRIGAFSIKGFTELFSGFERMQHLKGNLNKVVNKTIRALNKQATLGDKVAKRILKRQTKPVRRIVNLLDTYERLPDEVSDKMSATDVEAFNSMRDMTKWLLERANVSRKKAGLDPINNLRAYIPHWTNALATEIMNGTYIYNSGFLGQLMNKVPKKIDNPTAYHRKLNQQIQDHMEHDLGTLMRGLIRYDLHDIMLAQPLAEVWDELRRIRDYKTGKGGKIISDRAYRFISDFISYDVLKKQTTIDKVFNDAWAVKTSTQMINKVLRPLNREISNPATFYFGGMRKLFHAAFLPGRLRPITRNFGQFFLNLSFHRGRDLGRAQFGKQDVIEHPVTGKPIKILDYVREQDWYKLTKPEDTLDDNTLLSNLTKYGMVGYKLSHVGNRYVSNVERTALSSYYDWKHRFQESHTQSSKHYKHIVKESKRTGIPIKQLQTQKEDMLNDIRDGVTMTQWEYMSHALPTIMRGQIARTTAAYQSWWMNYFTSFLAEGYNRLITGRTRVRSDGTGGRLLTPYARLRVIKGMGGIYGMARIAESVFGVAMLGALWMPDPTSGLPPLLSLAVSMARLMLGFNKPEQRKQAWKDLGKTAKRLLPFSNAAREIAKVGDDWTLKDYVFYTDNDEWKQIWIKVEQQEANKKGGL